MIPANEYRWAAPLLDAYNRHLLRKSFSRLRVAGLDELRGLSEPAILTPNHSCWWDGCVDIFLSRSVLKSPTYLMMGETELARHRIFSSLGVFSVQESGADSVTSLRYVLDQLEAHRGHACLLWIYPDGVMKPARSRVEARPGTILVAERAGVPVIPVAHRFEFLRDDHPDILVRVGHPLRGLTRRGDGAEKLSTAITELLRHVDDDILAGSLDAYESVLEGQVSRNEQLRALRGER